MHLLCFIVLRSLTMVGLAWRTAGSLLRRLTLRYNLSTLEMRWQLVLVRYGSVAHCAMRRGKWC